MSKRVLVTGGAGFIGSHVAEAFLEDGWTVTVLDDLSRGSEHNIPAGADFIRADIRSPEAREAVAQGGFDLLNHHAAQIDVRVSVSEPRLDCEINVMGLVNLLEGAAAGGVGPAGHRRADLGPHRAPFGRVRPGGGRLPGQVVPVDPRRQHVE